MNEDKTSGPAFPRDHANDGHNGMTLRQYAAIKLRVPDSGSDWLDAMIRTSVRDDRAAQIMQGLSPFLLIKPEGHVRPANERELADQAYFMADRLTEWGV